MADAQIDANDLIQSFTNEIAALTRRALIAEAQAAAQKKANAEQQEHIAAITERLSALEADAPKRRAPTKG